MVNSGDCIIVGFSGGADSVCLLFLLKQLSEQMNFSLEAVHINHKLREEADEEEIFVKKLCGQWKVPCRTLSVNVETYAKENHLCIEEAARSLRYHAFEELISGREKTVKIALAHHRSDQAETVLFHLFRGSGIRGMAGIRPVRDCYIRPLLCVDRKEIEQLVRQENLLYVTDSSNFDTTYSRNKIRHDLLPMVEAEICQGSILHIAQSAEMIGDAVDFLDELTEQAYRELVTEEDNGCRIDKEKLSKQHPYLQSALIYEMLARTSKKKRDIAKIHVDSVRELLKGQSGRQLTLIYGLQAVIQQTELVIMTKPEEKACIDEVPLQIPGTVCVQTDAGKKELHIQCRLLSDIDRGAIPDKQYTKWLDYGKINSCPILRTRREGDYFYCSETAKKKLKEYFINEKVPLLERDRLLLIADGNHIIWIPGYRISSYYKVTEDTTQILEITISGGKENE